MAQIPCQCADIVGDGHLVVIENDHQIVQLADVVHSFVDHAAGKGTIADHRDHKPCFMMQLFGPRHADRKRKRRVSVPGNECIVFTLVRVRETGDPVELAQLIKLSAPTRKDLVCVALVTDIKHDFVLWCIQNTVRATVSSTTPRFEARWPPVLEIFSSRNWRISAHSCFTCCSFSCFKSLG